MKVLVLGGTGLLGNALLKILSKNLQPLAQLESIKLGIN